MTSNKDFYFGLLRVSMIQLLKSQGFDKSKPTTIDTITDLYLKFLTLLISEITRIAQARAGNHNELLDQSVVLQDITLAMTNLGIINPTNKLDVYDENPEVINDLGLIKFKDWYENSLKVQNARIVALPVPELLLLNDNPDNNKENILLDPTNKNIPNSMDYTQSSIIGSTTATATATTATGTTMIPDFINQLQNPSQQNDTFALEEEKRRQAKIQQENDLIEELINDGDVDDWIRSLIARQRLNLTHNKLYLSKKFNNPNPSERNDEDGFVWTLNNLPHLPGLKYSILENPLTNTYNNVKLIAPDQLLPRITSFTDEENENDTIRTKKIMETLNHLLPIMNPENKLENIILSFEALPSSDEEENNEDEDVRKDEDDDIDMDPNETNVHNYNNNNNTKTVGSFNFNQSIDTKYAELQDMDNTFQRRHSLEFDSTNNQFDYNSEF
ncbi:Taf3p NDAI_0C06160 [Naumovozyma dairenensis CBS 421]|uniref:Bromodomain associated domain-containing protein n=1 Tax=Naumovozyma dairenensis (strain ATCC 10597 / BCRC 20456 / CBS 421 / NBRC 0211 / NRRL Y-12639) TaxID=1071378 RepID=G0W914_NAUDC|nr:hypothetical protein NDAI_0C06160 [Naumovozyma dairenensis CBS 421]CCD24275.1 hypothetical protein NDAI_0C06160 [Naumovozyma dairenensis CBS 421]